MGWIAIILVLILAAGIFLCRSSKQENMTYLDQYEIQDNYRNVPNSWPIPYTSTTALYAAEREALHGVKTGCCD